MESCEIGPFENLTKCAIVPVSQGEYKVQVVVHLEGLVDFAVERTRVQKLIDKKKAEVMGITKRLSNKNFVDNAPQEIVDDANKQLVEIKSEIETLEESLIRLQ